MRQKILILGGTGMIGHGLFYGLSQYSDLDVYASAREDTNINKWFPLALKEKIKTNIDVNHFDSIIEVLSFAQPDVVINCVGLIKQNPLVENTLLAISINSLFPHRVASICRAMGIRMIHVSTDCVFSGDKGNYKETDPSDATDLYGRTKFLGEVIYPHCITLRTSIIGHELRGKRGLIEWFLSQQGMIKGFTHAIFTGLPTIEFARVIKEYVLSDPNLNGLYHVSAEPISKYDLLKLIAIRYRKEIQINPYDDFYSDRSLDSTRFQNATGYQPPSWEELVEKMYLNYEKMKVYYDQNFYNRNNIQNLEL